VKEQLLDTWQIHNRMNYLLLDAITADGMQKTLSSRGGRTILQQWIHLHNTRIQWLDTCSKDIAEKYTTLDKETTYRPALLRKALEDSETGIAELLAGSCDNNGGKVRGFRKGIIPLLGYFIAHEAHHRGNMLLTLKQSGEKIPDKVKWGLWEWSK
jgi:uncharacterized damage-inducible protein DinB